LQHPEYGSDEEDDAKDKLQYWNDGIALVVVELHIEHL
jgi:hypothetical protein